MRRKHFLFILILTGLAGIPSTAADSSLDRKLLTAAKHSEVRAVRALLSQHASPNAAEQDSAEIAGLLLKAGANAKAANRYGITPLQMACENGSAAIIQQLIEAGADANGTTLEGQTPLMTAARNCKLDAIKALIKHGAQMNAKKSWKGQTALMWAAAEGNADAVSLLIEDGAGVKTKAKSGFTPFLFAVRNGQINAARVLLDQGANVNDVSPDGTSALAMAAINAYYELGVMLVDKGANPNLPDPRGSVLHILAWMRKPGSDPAAGAGGAPKDPPIVQGNADSLDLAKAILAHGGNPNARVNWKEIKYNRDFGQVRLPLDIPIGRKYISYVGATPFYVAAQNGDAPYMRVLAAGGADPKMGTVQKISPLMAAAGIGSWDGESPGPYARCTEEERLEAVKTAIALGNDINYHADFGDYPLIGDPTEILFYYSKNVHDMPEHAIGDVRWTGSTALHGAVISGQIAIVKYLLDHGAAVNAKTRLGWTPLLLAKGAFVSNTKKEFPEIAQPLQQYTDLAHAN